MFSDKNTVIGLFLILVSLLIAYSFFYFTPDIINEENIMDSKNLDLQNIPESPQATTSEGLPNKKSERF